MTRCVLLLIALLSATPTRAAERVVSLNLCTDQLLVQLAPEDVAGLTTLSRDASISYVAEAAQHLPIVRADAEAVLLLHPDLVLAGPYGAQTTVTLLRELGRHVVMLPLPENFAGIRQETRDLARLLGVPSRGDALITQMDARLAALPHPAHLPTALLWQPRGYTAGPGTLGDAVLRAAGLRNVGTGAESGWRRWWRTRPICWWCRPRHAFPPSPPPCWTIRQPATSRGGRCRRPC